MGNTIIIGGGAAGMLAAATAAQNGRHVTLLEQNEKLGKKLYITGKGRCNLTNAGGKDAFFANVVRNPRFLYSAWSACNHETIMHLIEGLGVPLKTERGDRVYPASDKSSDVLRALARHLERCGVHVRLHTPAKGILVKDGRVKAVLLKNEEQLQADAVILATGGASYPATGARGDGYAFAQEVGHSIVPPAPSLIPLETVEDWPRSLSGLTLKNVRLHAYENKKVVYAELGEMLFTHFGVSGPLVLSASAYLKTPANAALTIDLKPGLSYEQLHARVLRDIQAHQRMALTNAFSGLLPKSLLPIVLGEASIDAGAPAGSFSKQQREQLVRVLKALPLTIRAARPIEEAIVTKGGVSTKEVHASSLESKLVGGLYFAGEILDVDALTGGYNLQIAWSTGMLAGMLKGEEPIC